MATVFILIFNEGIKLCKNGNIKTDKVLLFYCFQSTIISLVFHNFLK